MTAPASSAAAVALAPEPDGRVDAVLGRRERKKLATREALAEAAVRLFAAQGYDATTVEDIAEAVDVSARTFHRYFASKEDVLFADGDARRALFAATLASRPADEPLLASLRAGCLALGDVLGDRGELERLRLAVVESDDRLRSRSVGSTEQLVLVVAEHVAARLDLPADDRLPRLVGSVVVATLRTASARWRSAPRSTDLVAEIATCLDALADLGPLLRATPAPASAIPSTSAPRTRRSRTS